MYRIVYSITKLISGFFFFEFHFLLQMTDLQIYEKYCQNKPRSESLWRQCSDCTFFQVLVCDCITWKRCCLLKTSIEHLHLSCQLMTANPQIFILKAFEYDVSTVCKYKYWNVFFSVWHGWGPWTFIPGTCIWTQLWVVYSQNKVFSNIYSYLQKFCVRCVVLMSGLQWTGNGMFIMLTLQSCRRRCSLVIS